MKVVHVVNVSGGKDSAVVALMAKEEQARRKARGVDMELLFVFSDTGHEHKHTYEWLDYFETKLDAPILRIKHDHPESRFENKRKKIQKLWGDKGISQDNIDRGIKNTKKTGHQFTDEAILQSGFPTSGAKFCTRVLKIENTQKQVINKYTAEGTSVIQWLGTRRAESKRRAKRTRFYTMFYSHRNRKMNKPKFFEVLYYPIRDMKVDEVFAFLKSRGVTPNPLYGLGFSRVGCAPCIFATKPEIKRWQDLFPERMGAVKRMERLVSLASTNPEATSFFTLRGKAAHDRYDRTGKAMKIDEQVKWANGTLGINGKLDVDDEEDVIEEDCDSGFCE